MQIQLVDLKGAWIFDSVEDFVRHVLGLNMTLMGEKNAPNAAAHLRGLPKFKELHGPMAKGTAADGKPKIRYETAEAFAFSGPD